MLTRGANKKKRPGENGSNLSGKNCKKQRSNSKKEENTDTETDIDLETNSDCIPEIQAWNLENDLAELIPRDRVKDALISCMALDELELRNFGNPLILDEVNLDTYNTPKQQKRNLTAVDVIDSSEKERSHINANSLGIPIGPNAQTFAGHIGKAVKYFISVKYTKWSEVPEDAVKRCWIFLNKLYVIPTTQSLLIKWITRRLKDRFSGYKSKLYCSVAKKFETMDEMIANCPTRIPHDEWESFIKFRNSAEFLETSKQCQEGVKKRKTFHVLGRKSFAQLEEELKEKGGPGYSVNRVDLWKAGYVTEKNTPSAKYAAAISKKINERIASGSPVETGKNDVLAEVLGPDRKGRVRAVGSLITSSTVFGSETVREELIKCKAEIAKQNDRLEKNEKHIEMLEKELCELKTLLQQQLIMQQCINHPMKNIEVGENEDLTEEVAEILSSCFKDEGRFATLNYHERSNIKVTYATLQCLDACKVLRDDVIDLYFALLKDREERVGISPNMLRCHYFNTQFYNELYNEHNKYDYQAVEEWTQHEKIGYYLANCRFVFVPVNIEQHWSLGAIDVKRRKIMHLDPTGKGNDNVTDNLIKYIVDELKNKNYMEMDFDDWTKDTIEGLSIQSNMWDCGMFILKYAEYFSRGTTTLDFGQDDIKKFRYVVRDQLLRLVIE